MCHLHSERDGLRVYVALLALTLLCLQEFSNKRWFDLRMSTRQVKACESVHSTLSTAYLVSRYLTWRSVVWVSIRCWQGQNLGTTSLLPLQLRTDSPCYLAIFRIILGPRLGYTNRCRFSRPKPPKKRQRLPSHVSGISRYQENSSHQQHQPKPRLMLGFLFSLCAEAFPWALHLSFQWGFTVKSRATGCASQISKVRESPQKSMKVQQLTNQLHPHQQPGDSFLNYSVNVLTLRRPFPWKWIGTVIPN